jgi:hypothetical protein
MIVDFIKVAHVRLSRGSGRRCSFVEPSSARPQGITREVLGRPPIGLDEFVRSMLTLWIHSISSPWMCGMT